MSRRLAALGLRFRGRQYLAQLEVFRRIAARIVAHDLLARYAQEYEADAVVMDRERGVPDVGIGNDVIDIRRGATINSVTVRSISGSDRKTSSLRRMKLMTPAMASDPYCAAAPSRSSGERHAQGRPAPSRRKRLES